VSILREELGFEEIERRRNRSRMQNT